MKSNATASRDTFCRRCRRAIAKGTRCSVFRERAVTSAEARHAGTLYPLRLWCAPCALFRGKEVVGASVG